MRSAAAITLVVLAGFSLASCRSSGKAPVETPRTPLAEVNGRKITVGDLDARMGRIPRLARAEFTGAEGRSRMVQRVVEEEMLLLAAKSEGVERDAEVRAKLEEARRETIVQAYLDRKQGEASKVTEEEMRAYYDAHPDEYTTEEAVRVRLLIMHDRKRLEAVRTQVASGTISFEDACRKFSEDPEISTAAGLVPEWVRRGRAVPWIGNHPTFHAAAFSIPPGEISPILETPKGLLILQVEEQRPPARRAFEESRADIERRLASEKSTQALPKLLEDLKKRYKVKVYAPEGESAERVFSKAQSTPDPAERIKLYRQILDLHPGDSHAVEALFMIGFIQNEELQDREAAKKTFREVIEKFPKSELAESAKWMLTDESQKSPAFDADSAAAVQRGSS